MIFFGSKERARARSRDQGFKVVFLHQWSKVYERGQIEKKKFEVLIPEK
jgi:hypothetical protein